MKKVFSQKGFSPLLIVVLIFLALAGVLIYQRQLTQPLPAATDEAANWKVYNYNDFSFKLPQEWTEYSSKNPIQLVNYEVKEIGSGFSPQIDQSKLKIEIYSGNSNLALKDYIAQQKTQTLEIKGSDWPWDETDLSVGGQIAVKVKSGAPGFTVYIQNTQKTRVYQIVFALDFDNYQNLANKILSTFKFTQ